MPNTYKKKSNRGIIFLLLGLAVVGGLSFYFGARRGENGTESQTTPTPTPTINTTPTSTVAITPTPSGIAPTISITGTPAPIVTLVPETTQEGTKQIKVFFSKDPDSMNNFTYAEWRFRNTTRMDVATFAVEQMIKGPNETEQTAKLFTPIKLTGESNCEGKDFKISIDSASKGTIKFCKNIETAGTGDDARIKSVIDNALKQFPTITKVAILTKDDACFGDMSGQNLCKQ